MFECTHYCWMCRSVVTWVTVNTCAVAASLLMWLHTLQTWNVKKIIFPLQFLKYKHTGHYYFLRVFPSSHNQDQHDFIVPMVGIITETTSGPVACSFLCHRLPRLLLISFIICCQKCQNMKTHFLMCSQRAAELRVHSDLSNMNSTYGC